MPDSPTLARRAIKAAKWGYLGAAGKLIIQLGAQVVLARLLGPSEYGLFAIGTIVVGLSNFFADAGIGAILVQKAEIDDELIKFVAGWQWVAGATVTILLCLCAPLIANYFNEPRAINIIRLMSLVCLLGALSSVPSNLLRRKLDFKPLQMAQLLGFFVGYVLVGIPCAWYGAGVWSLVYSWLTQACITCVYVYIAARPPRGVSLHMKGGFETLKFGGGALLSNLSTWTGTNADKVVIGRYFSTYDLGLYNAVNNLLSTAVTQVLSTLQSVLFSASSRISSDREQMGRSYLLLLEVGSLLFLPIFGCVATIPEIVLVGLYGPKWQAGANVLTPIALSMAAYGLAGLVTPLLWASGKIHVEGRIQLAGAVAIAISTIIVSSFNQLYFVAWAVFACIFVRAFWSLLYTAKILNLNFLSVIKSLRPGFYSAIGISFLLYISSQLFLRQFFWSIQKVFVLMNLIGIGAYLLSFVLFIKTLTSPELYGYFKKFRMRR